MPPQTVHKAEYRGYEKQSSDGGAKQTADNGTPERGILLAAFAETQRHGDHADDHSESGHNNGTETGVPGFNSSLQRIAMLGQTLTRKRNHQDAVGGRDPHTHDGPHERRHAEMGSR